MPRVILDSPAPPVVVHAAKNNAGNPTNNMILELSLLAIGAIFLFRTKYKTAEFVEAKTASYTDSVFRNSRGDKPFQRLKAREKLLLSVNPSR
jgi:hypothetical protein